MTSAECDCVPTASIDQILADEALKKAMLKSARSWDEAFSILLDDQRIKVKKNRQLREDKSA